MFYATNVLMGGLVNKRRFRLTGLQKYRLGNRLKQVDNVVQSLVDSKVEFKALDIAKRTPKVSELSPIQKYWVASKRFRNGLKPLHWVPHWCKVAHPRSWKPSFFHQP